MMHRGNYEAEVELEPEARGRVLLANGDGFDFVGASFDELEREFATSAREYEADCRERGREPARTTS